MKFHDTFLHRMFRKIRQSKATFTVYVFFCVISVGVIIYSALTRNWTGCFDGVLALILFLIPPFLEETLKIEFSTVLEIVVLCFVFCAEILGEVGMYYTRYPFWDDLLHGVNGVLFAAFGFALADLCNRNRHLTFRMSPFFVALVACCFSLTIGVLWEFFEYAMDTFQHTDMQKDTVVTVISSGFFNQNGQTPVAVKGIAQTVVTTSDGSVYSIPGYLDIGLHDTMKDLAIDFLGALAYSVFGYFYVRRRGKSTRKVARLAASLIPVVPDSDTSEGPCESGEN